MIVNGWNLFQHPLFQHEYDKLLQKAQRLQKQKPKEYKNHKTVKLLAKVTQLITKEIPAEPFYDRFNQGNTLGTEYRHWKRAKFGRYRLFFRYQCKTRPDGSEEKVIVYVWINDRDTLRKAGDKNDPYMLFAKSLKRGKPPDSFDVLLKESTKL